MWCLQVSISSKKPSILGPRRSFQIDDVVLSRLPAPLALEAWRWLPWRSVIHLLEYDGHVQVGGIPFIIGHIHWRAPIFWTCLQHLEKEQLMSGQLMAQLLPASCSSDFGVLGFWRACRRICGRDRSVSIWVRPWHRQLADLRATCEPTIYTLCCSLRANYIHIMLQLASLSLEPIPML